MNLYIVHVGFYDEEIGIYELHSNFLVAAKDIRDAKENIKRKEIFINKRMHIDGIMEVKYVDGYEIKLEMKASSTGNNEYDYNAIKVL